MTLYNLSVPTLQHYLKQLDAMLVNAQQHLNVNETDFLRSRLAPDMFPLWQQILTTISFSLRASAPLTNLTAPLLDYQEKSFNHLHRDIDTAQKFLKQLTPKVFCDDKKIISYTAGQAQNETRALEYLQHYALPNFFFHLTCVYAILRQQGVSMSKGDFDGFHQYP